MIAALGLALSSLLSFPDEPPAPWESLRAVVRELELECGEGVAFAAWVAPVEPLGEGQERPAPWLALRADERRGFPGAALTGANPSARSIGQRMRELAVIAREDLAGAGKRSLELGLKDRGHSLLGRQYLSVLQGEETVFRGGWTWLRGKSIAYALLAWPGAATSADERAQVQVDDLEQSRRAILHLEDRLLRAARRSQFGDSAPSEFLRRGEFVACPPGTPVIRCVAGGELSWASTSAVPLFVADPRRGEVVADLGCGNGNEARAIARELGSETIVLGRDASRPKIDASWTGKLANLSFGLSELGDVCLDEQSVDLAYMVQVLHYILLQKSTQEAFARSLYTALYPGGEFVIIQYKGTAAELSSADRLFGGAGFEIGRKFEIWDRRGRSYYSALEYRRPPHE